VKTTFVGLPILKCDPELFSRMTSKISPSLDPLADVAYLQVPVKSVHELLPTVEQHVAAPFEVVQQFALTVPLKDIIGASFRYQTPRNFL
jgi:hypothetical protein